MVDNGVRQPEPHYPLTHDQDSSVVSPVMRLLLCLSSAIAIGCAGQSAQLRVATTTSVDNSGLLQAILPSFQQDTGIEVQVLAVGSGRALSVAAAR